MKKDKKSTLQELMARTLSDPQLSEIRGKMLSDEQEQVYLKSHGTRCPYCCSNNIEAQNHPTVDGIEASQLILCLKCGKRWLEWYSLVGISEI